MARQREHKKKARRYSSAIVFFPLAACYGAGLLPLSIQALTQSAPWLSALDNPLTHAHEMLFGYALAVVTGFLLTRAPAWQIGLLTGLWLAARLTVLGQANVAVAGLSNAAYALSLALLVAPKFMKGAKKWRNKVFGPLILALATLPIAWHALALLNQDLLQRVVAHEAVLVFSLLMLFMGGRVIAPAAAGAMQNHGRVLEARVQPNIEGGLLLSMAAAIIIHPLDESGYMTASVLMVAAILATVRILRWRFWHWRGRPDLLCILTGYAWLPIGLSLIAAERAFAVIPANLSVHAITIGALGTLTSTIMARVWLLRKKRDPARNVLIPVITALMSLATLLRITLSAYSGAIGMAAAAWSLALTLLLVLFLGNRARSS